MRFPVIPLLTTTAVLAVTADLPFEHDIVGERSNAYGPIKLWLDLMNPRSLRRTLAVQPPAFDG